MQQSDFFLAHAHRVIRYAQTALSELLGKVDDEFIAVCRAVAATRGNVITMAVGKSAFVAKKFSATLASLGQPSFFVHPCDAGHGDCGNITENDTVIMFSNSGKTVELANIMPALVNKSPTLIALVGAEHEVLCAHMDLRLVLGVHKEACALALAPTTSTTVFGVLADAICVCVSDMQGISEQAFAKTHPYGMLGRHLTVRLRDVMQPVAQCAKVFAHQSIVDSAIAMARQSTHMALVYNEEDTFIGVQSAHLLSQAMTTHANPTVVTNQHYIMQPELILAQDMLLYDAHSALNDQTAYALVSGDDPNQPVGLWLP